MKGVVNQDIYVAGELIYSNGEVVNIINKDSHTYEIETGSPYKYIDCHGVDIMKDVINVNQIVRVRILDDGIDILVRLSEEGISVPEIVDNHIEIQLWKLMGLFGEFIALGYEPIDYNIYFRKEDLYE